MPELAAKPELTLVTDPLTGFDGELTEANLRLLAERVRALDDERLRLKAELQVAEDTVKGHEGTLRSQSATITALKRNKEREMKRSKLYPQAKRCWELHKSLTNNNSKRSTLTFDRFDLIATHLKGGEEDDFDPGHQGPPRNALEECMAAIVGRISDHYVTRRANGTLKRHWGWELTFRDADKFEESRDRRPRDWRNLVAEHDPGPQ